MHIGEKKNKVCMRCYRKENKILEDISEKIEKRYYVNMSELPKAIYELTTHNGIEYKKENCDKCTISKFKICDECQNNTNRWNEHCMQQYDKLKETKLYVFLDTKYDNNKNYKCYHYYSCEACANEMNINKKSWKYEPKGFVYYVK